MSQIYAAIRKKKLKATPGLILIAEKDLQKYIRTENTRNNISRLALEVIAQEEHAVSLHTRHFKHLVDLLNGTRPVNAVAWRCNYKGVPAQVSLRLSS